MSVKQHSVLPGFGLTMGCTLSYLSLLVLIPLAGLFLKSASIGWQDFWETVTDSTAIDAYKLSFGASLAAAALNAVFGLVVAWTLVRYPFFGKKFVDAVVDLPFAMPTAVSGIALSQLYSKEGWIGQWLAPYGIEVTYTPLGIMVALTFVGLPFVVRTLQPALEDMDMEVEEAAASLGATRWQTLRRVILPTILPSLLTGFALAFARALGEYGSVIFMSTKAEMVIPTLIVTKLGQSEMGSEGEAAAIAVVTLGASFLVLLFINLTQWWSRRYTVT
jgi:sulfate/thiosulfate transport system permease protein